MWKLILLAVVTCLLAGIVWLSFAMCRFGAVRRWLNGAKWWKRMLCGLLLVVLLMLLLYLALDFVNMVIVMLHLLFIWMGCDLVNSVTRRIRRKAPKRYYAGVAAFVLTFVWLTIGWHNAHDVQRTEYHLTTEKVLPSGPLKIVGLSDSHVGATFHHKEFAEYVERINGEEPDMVVVMGDFVDDDTSLEDMQESCRALGKLRTRYGVYLVYGNHDAGYWANSGRGYTLADMDRLLEANGVRVLRDETVPIVDGVSLCGRLDKSRSPERKSAKLLTKDVRTGDYLVCLDHQPNDYEAEAASGMDLVVSGHTHGGQFAGFGALGVWMGANDAYYGYERRGGTDFIVSSGIGDWAIRFKTGCIAEYVVITVDNAR